MVVILFIIFVLRNKVAATLTPQGLLKILAAGNFTSWLQVVIHFYQSTWAELLVVKM